jgi:hypothetical protein
VQERPVWQDRVLMRSNALRSRTGSSSRWIMLRPPGMNKVTKGSGSLRASAIDRLVDKVLMETPLFIHFLCSFLRDLPASS